MAGVDPKRAAENWAYVRRAGRRYLLALVLALLIVFGGVAYAFGYFNGVQWGRLNPAPGQSQESES